jgi:sulfatase maturation enzyme AslB (radical SAM superfamily)
MEHMSPELAVRVIEAIDEGLANVETVCIHFYGGEPLLNLPAMRAILEHSGKKKPSLLLSLQMAHAAPRQLWTCSKQGLSKLF